MPGSVVVSESRFADDMTICEGSREAAVRSFCAVRDRAAKEGFEALKRPLWKRSEISVKTKMRVPNACVYGAETWTMYAVSYTHLTLPTIYSV